MIIFSFIFLYNSSTILYLNKFPKNIWFMDFSVEGIKEGIIKFGNSFANSLKEPPTISGLAVGILVVVLVKLKENIGLALIAGFLTGGFVYLIYNDFLQRREIASMEDQKMENVKDSIKDQRNQDLDKNVCLSCNAKIMDSSKPCPKCGFLLEKIKIE